MLQAWAEVAAVGRRASEKQLEERQHGVMYVGDTSELDITTLEKGNIMSKGKTNQLAKNLILKKGWRAISYDSTRKVRMVANKIKAPAKAGEMKQVKIARKKEKEKKMRLLLVPKKAGKGKGKKDYKFLPKQVGRLLALNAMYITTEPFY